MPFNTRAQAFIEGIVRLARQYNVSLGHEDTQGGFIVHDVAQENLFIWLRDARFESESTQDWIERREGKVHGGGEVMEYWFRCPDCNGMGAIDEEQVDGKVSIVCPNSEFAFHETGEVEEKVPTSVVVTNVTGLDKGARLAPTMKGREGCDEGFGHS